MNDPSPNEEIGTRLILKGRMARHRSTSEETTSWRLRQNEERSWEIARRQKREPLRVESLRKTVGGVRKGLTPI